MNEIIENLTENEKLNIIEKSFGVRPASDEYEVSDNGTMLFDEKFQQKTGCLLVNLGEFTSYAVLIDEDNYIMEEDSKKVFEAEKNLNIELRKTLTNKYGERYNKLATCFDEYISAMRKYEDYMKAGVYNYFSLCNKKGIFEDGETTRVFLDKELKWDVYRRERREFIEYLRSLETTNQNENSLE